MSTHKINEETLRALHRMRDCSGSLDPEQVARALEEANTIVLLAKMQQAVPDRPLHFMTTYNIATRWPDKQQRAEGIKFFDGKNTFFSRGRLEAVVAGGYRPVVISSRGEAGAQDDWWMELVLPEDVHFFGPAADLPESSFLDFCIDTIGAVYGLNWPMGRFEDGKKHGEEYVMGWREGLAELTRLQTL